jgi:hypothetical protein
MRNLDSKIYLPRFYHFCDISWIEISQRSSLLPYRGVLSFRSEAWEASGSETARLHHAARRRGDVAARGAGTAGGLSL